MSLIRLSLAALLLFLSGCEAPAPEPGTDPTPPVLSDDDDATNDDDDDSVGDCSPALTLSPADSSVVRSSGLRTFTATGGTGAWHFTLTENNSGGQVSGDYGTYLPGSVTGVDDEITVTDDGCVGSASVTVHVVNIMDVSPTSVEASPNTNFEILVASGSGSYACSLWVNGTGATLSEPCGYEGGSLEGLDVVRVEDLETLEVVDVRVELSSGAQMMARPERIWIPVGGTYELRTSGGSGYVTATSSVGTAVQYSEGVFEAVSPGPTEFDFVDDFTGQTTTVATWGVAALEGGFPRAGDNQTLGDSASPGDLNGDGHADVLLGIVEADWGNYNNGVVHVYAGRADGIEADPVQTLAGDEYSDFFGGSLHVADMTGDGELDLLVGTYLSDAGGANAGEVKLFSGIPGGFFEQTASKSWTGDHSSDFFGSGVTSCDFNGDGYEDLAVGALADEDRTVTEIAYSQGSVWFFLGGPNGLAEQPSQKVYGSVPDGAGGWMYSGEVRLGRELEAGDVNGDGICDLVVGAYEFEPPNENGNDGAVFVYLGADSLGSSTAVFGAPVVAWAGLDPDSRDSYLGRELDVGDVDADGLDDILIGQYRENAPGLSGDRHGAARLFLGEPWSYTPATEWVMPSEAVWSWFGNNGYDAVGHEVRLREMTGDGAADILVSGYNEEVPGGINSTGAIVTFAGVPGGVPADSPSAWFAGTVSGELYGVRVEGLPDLDGDGVADLFVYASRADNHGYRAGVPYFHPSTLGATAVPLGNPGDSSGQRAGEGVAVLGDLNSDGYEEVAVGVPEYDNAGNQINAGMVQIFFGTSTGLSGTAFEIKEFTGYSDGDRWGWRVVPAGDFDADGFPDVAILGRYEDRPNSFSNAFVSGPCAGGGSNTGAVAIFRGKLGGGLETEPAFLWWGTEVSDSILSLAGGFDIDGDGYSDLAAGSRAWDGTTFNDMGGLELIHGRPADPGGIVVICNGERFMGSEASGRMGDGITTVGDLDFDGCDEVAVGASDEDAGYSNQGVVRILWGFGPGCNTVRPDVSVLVPQDSNARAGYSLAGGHDVDGDGLPDLVVGGYFRSTGGNSTGAAWLVPGSYLLSLPREPFVSEMPILSPSIMSPNTGGPYIITGSLQDEQLGRSVALLPGLGENGTAGIAVGAPRSNLPGVDRVGGVQVHLWDSVNGGVNPVPWGAFGGESFTPNGRVGESIAGGSFRGNAGLVVGGYRAGTWGPAQGAAWFIPMQP